MILFTQRLFETAYFIYNFSIWYFGCSQKNLCHRNCWKCWRSCVTFRIDYCNLKRLFNYKVLRQWNYTAQKIKFSIKDFFRRCHQISSKLRIRSHLLKNSLMENFIFCAVLKDHWISFHLSEILPKPLNMGIKTLSFQNKEQASETPNSLFWDNSLNSWQYLAGKIVN